MPLPAELDCKIRRRFSELIEQGNALVSADVVGREHNYTTWSLHANTFLKQLFNQVPGSREVVLLNLFERHQTYPANLLDSFASAMSVIEWTNRLRPLVQHKVTVLKALQDSYIDGDYEDLETRIASHVLTNLMEQAEALLGEGIERQYDHVPAAMLCGAVLEHNLRRFCEQQESSIEITNRGGSFKTLGPLIGELEKKKAFDKLIFKNLKVWADIRNSAAHGQFDKFSRLDVEQMLAGVRQFLDEHVYTKYGMTQED